VDEKSKTQTLSEHAQTEALVKMEKKHNPY